ncbi:DUF4178 domain-containing protein [Pontibacter sp. G13]|uniref:DUF4178 domain-containing protein n=1 Tax=Pontibacter sp. G13 TaxID=3074898 RepID=UPI00288C28E2|nr:DUF4178 domain-containing protein [Pontibacter sp. G13]WNJ15949.1 DUF4178 domain-containing protein [Pontibacter sp. G13]
MSIVSRSFTCPSCGAPIEHTFPGARSLVCNYCGQTSHLNADDLEAAGDKHLLIDYGSVFEIGQRGAFQEKSFTVLGRIRLAYDGGFWDEWFVQFDDLKEGWIQEDDGQFVMFQKVKDLQTSLKVHHLKVGQWTTFEDQYEKTFITHTSSATVQGGEGQLPFRIIPGEPADFADGILKGRPVSVELLPDEQALFVGVPFRLDQISLN